jgi:hypothetical protein
MRSRHDTNGTATSFVSREATAIHHRAADRGRERVIAPAKLAKRVRGLRFVIRALMRQERCHARELPIALTPAPFR